MVQAENPQQLKGKNTKVYMYLNFNVRWLKQSERKHCTLCRELIGDNLEVELAPFSFKLADGGEEIRGAAHAYTASLTAKIFQLLEQNEMYMIKGSLCVIRT